MNARALVKAAFDTVRADAPLRFQAKEPGRLFDLYEMQRGKTWSLIWNKPPHDGLEVTLITGKKRLATLLAALKTQNLTDFWATRKFAYQWRKDNPR
jgi:hypothetical protein